MALKYKYSKREDVPAEQVGFYVEREGVFVLDAEGGGESAKLDEFRATNVAVLKENAALKARYAGIDPEAARALAGEKLALVEAAQLAAGQVDEVIAARVKAARAEWLKGQREVEAERDALHGRLSAIQIDQAVVSEATKRGLRATALPDLAARARQNFKLVGGVAQAMAADGQTPQVGADGVTPVTLAEWVGALVTDAPHLFSANAGGGAAGSGSGGAGNGAGANPFRKESWNVTAQMVMQKTDPGLAARLKAVA